MQGCGPDSWACRHVKQRTGGRIASAEDRFTRYNVDRAVIRERIGYAKSIRKDLEHPFDPERIKVPVTSIWGDRDRLCVPAGARKRTEMLPHTKLVMLEGVGHTPQVEAPDVVVEAIEELAAKSG